MIASRIALCLVFVASLACAGSKSPQDSGGPGPGDDEGDDEGDDKGGQGEQGEQGEQVCMADADCVPAQCCHPTNCVPAAQAPDCSDIACTQECQPKTMDCGQGHCACEDGACTAVIDDAL
jgi:hypothetical protein